MAKKKNELDELKKRQNAVLSGNGLSAVKNPDSGLAPQKTNIIQQSAGRAQQAKQAAANEKIRASHQQTAPKVATGAATEPKANAIQQSQGRVQQAKQAAANRHINARRAAQRPIQTRSADQPAVQVKPVQSAAEKTAFERFGREWREARARGDQAGMDAAHAKAEALRGMRGYSGGADGSRNIRTGTPTSGSEVGVRAAFAALGMDEGAYNARAIPEVDKALKRQSDLDKALGVLGLVGRNTMAGVSQFNAGLAKTADLILPDVITPKAVQNALDWYKQDAERTAEETAQENFARGGKAGQLVGQLYQGTVASAPQAIIAMLTGGASEAQAAIDAMRRAGVSANVISAVQEAVKNPGYWASFAQTIGSDYEDAKAAGASEDEALTTAFVSSLLNAGIEIGGGVEQMARNTGRIGLRDVAKSAFEEGLEEVEQGITSGVVSKAVYDRDRAWASTNDQNAILNPARMAQEFAGGAVAGGILSGGGAILSNIGRGADARTGVQANGENALMSETQTIGRENVRPEQVTTQREPTANTEAMGALANRASEAEAAQTVEGGNPGTLRQGTWGENEVRPQVRTEEDVRPETPDYEAEQRAQEIAQRQFDAREAQLEAEARAEEIERMGREQLEQLESESYRLPDEEREARRDEILREMAEGQLEALESNSFDVDNTGMRAEDAPMGPEDTEQRHELPAEPTALDIARTFDRVWEAERQLDEAEGRIALSNRDESQVQAAMINGGNIDWNLCDDPQAAMHIYQMRRAVEDARRPWRDFIAERNDARAEMAAQAAEMFDGARDKIGISYARETMERNLYDIMGSSQQGQANARNLIDAYITPVHERVARGNRLKNELRGRVRAMNLNKTESQYTQYLLEGRNDEALNFLNQNNGRIDQDKCRDAADEFRQIYNDLHDRINEALVNGGYEPAKFRRNYAPHFRETTATTMLGRIAQALGFYTPGVDAIPTDLAGITDTFRPGRKWFGNLLQRETDATAYDAVKGFDMYVETAADVITLTESIRDLNALEDAIRYRFSDQGTRDTVDKIRNDRTLNPLEKLRKSEEAYENARMGMGGFVTELRKYSNHLAGKKDRADRGWEDAFGRGVYSMARQMDSRFRANMVGGNLGSAITNFIPLTQAVGEVRADRLAVGMMDTLRARAQNDGFVNCSSFLTNRRGSERLDKTAAQRFGDIIGAPMTIVDNFTAESIVRAAYRQNLAQGDDYNTAMARADAFAARLMADRSKGAVPSAFRAQNPVMRALTAFQIEVNNQLSYMAKDLPRELGDEGAARVAAALAEIFVCGWMFNQGYHALTGREAAFEPITLLKEIFEIARDDDEETDALDKMFSAGGVTLEWMAENTPVVGSFFGGGRVPISSALPDTDKLGSALQALRNGNGKKAAQDFYAGVKNPLFYLAPPAGGGAIKKAVEGAALIQNGGVYGYNDKGERQLKFAHDSSDPWANVQAVLFGQYATPEAEAYVDGGFKSLSADQTARYEQMRDVGVGTDDAYALAHRAAKLSDEAFQVLETLVSDGMDANAAADIMDEYVAIKKDAANRNSPDEGVSAGSSGRYQMEKRFRDILLADDRLSEEQKRLLDMAVLKSEEIVPDYTDEDSLYLSTAFKHDADNRKAARVLRDEYGLPVAKYAEYLSIEKNLGVDAKSEKHRQLATIIKNDKSLDEDGREALFRATILADNKTWAEGYAKKLHEDMTAEECAALAIRLEGIKEAYQSKDESEPHRVSDMADRAFAVLFAATKEKEKEEKQKTSADKLADTAFSKWLDEQGYSDELREKIMDAFSVDPIPYRWDMLTTTNEKKYAGALENSGIDISVYLDCKDFSGAAKSDKDSKGKTINGSKKAKVLKYVREQCQSERQVAAVMRALGYSYDSGSGAKTSTPKKAAKPKTLKMPKSLKSLF